MVALDGLLEDLTAEGDDLDRLVADLTTEAWSTPTPAEGWTVAHQVAHLVWTDEVAVVAATDEAAFGAVIEQALLDVDGFVDQGADEVARSPHGELLARWRRGRVALVDALRAVPEGQKVPWFGPPMSAASMATARLMETWAHGQDVVDALGVGRAPTARLRNIAHIGVRTRDFAYVSNHLDPPADPFLVELTAPDGDTWTWGPPAAAQQVRGPAVDFCLLVTQRRHRDDLELSAVGDDADRWLSIAQAFAGPAGGGRRPGQFDPA